MAPRPATITQNELAGYGKAMTEAGIPVWSLVVEKPDGTRLTIMAGSAVRSGSDRISKMLDESQ